MNLKTVVVVAGLLLPSLAAHAASGPARPGFSFMKLQLPSVQATPQLPIQLEGILAGETLSVDGADVHSPVLPPVLPYAEIAQADTAATDGSSGKRK